ncbi:helix-turn-helix domain-containing protein [Microbulbifer spongiae]|uniref:AraC family transcriptional regulator n=1 Tax=Microbulbifer spongiae TaxID=2944933 RepID=A0ABY9E5A9_9GAMM|nr:AraC family transcriptional regulator [Microbulbifer sp. MI-G]WKD48204.1 AraC family transcriptional regulator [Microbulbifer sp. MI-G]
MTAFQCTLFAFFLLVVRSERRVSNALLALFLLSQAAIPLDILISFGAGFRDWAIQVSPNLFYIFGFAYWLEGPLLLWYTRSLVYKGYQPQRRELVYLLPLLGYVIYEYFVYFRFDSLTKVEMLQDYDLFAESALTHGIGTLREILRWVFGIACLVELRRYHSRIRDSYSTIEKIGLRWLWILVVGFLIIRSWAVLVNIAIIFSAHLDTLLNYRAMGLASNYTVLILVSALIFMSLRGTSVFDGLESEATSGEPLGKNIGSAKKSADTSKPQIDPELVEKVERSMTREHLFLTPTLTLADLAQHLGAAKRIVSTTINRHFGCNFFEFVNQYRIEEAKARLADPACEGQTVLEIMLAVGFNTKGTFNTLFKKRVGMTPTEFRFRSRALAPLPESTI